MGCYINPGGWPPESPTHLTKEEFLSEHGLEEPDVHAFAIWENCPTSMLPVIWVDNGFMTAAGVCYKASELRSFLADLDRTFRPHKFYYVDTAVLRQVSPLDDYLNGDKVEWRNG